MFLGAYSFVGNPDELVPAYDRLMSDFPAGQLILHVCVVAQDEILVLDACPTEEVFRQFSTDPGFRGACKRAGLPEPTIKHLGEVHRALLPNSVE